MTLQVAMIASDGWLLASDRRSRETSSAPDGGSVSVAKDVSKIKLMPQGLKIAYSSAGTDIMRDVGVSLETAVKRGWSNGTDIATELGKLGAKFSLPNLPPFGSHRLIIAVFENIPELWTLDIGRSRPPEKVDQWSLAGDFWSGARILPQLYYTRRKCNELVQLAAFTILSGNLFNPSNIAGLDILMAKEGKNTQPTFLGKSEIETLKQEFKSFDALLANLFLANLDDLSNYR